MTRLARNICLLLLTALAVPLLFQGQDPVRRTSDHWIRDRFLREGRAGACTATLPDGRMLATGGQGSRGALGTAEYLSVTGDYLSASPMNVARSEQVCAALPDGRLLVAGGRVTGDAATNAAEIYDPSTDLWTNIPAMGEARIGATVTPLVGGTVLIAGGEASGLASATLEIFDPNTETFSFAGSVMSSPRKNHAATRLPDGRVLIAGGTDGRTALATVDVFDPASGSIHSLGRMSTPRDGLSATLLDNGQVLLAGGSDGAQDLASSDLFDTRSGSMAAGPAMSSPRRGHQAFLMPHNNTVMIVGGTSAGEPLASTEQFVWWAGSYRGQFKTVDSLSSARSKMTGAASDTGMLTIAGGRTADGALSLVSNTVPVATVTSDKLDYQPGDVVYLSGAGFGPNDVVHVVIHETPTTHADVALDITADATGAFNHVDVYHVEEHDLGITFHLIATGSPSGVTAETSFTDNRNLVLTFAGTGTGTVKITPSVGLVTAPIGCGGTGAFAISQTVTSTCLP
ncbi:MAG TPA: kelch repeat-containing protein, partial [Bryobacteraceae bacterium]|nr:kelch repeat-containing protein [Bryobacteraceae bacterium]